MDKIPEPIPQVGLIYNHYDDGKFTESRRESVLIIKIIPADSLPDDHPIIQKWNKEKQHYTHLYNKVTDYFIIGKSITFPDHGIPIYVRTKSNQWFSIVLDNQQIAWANEGTLDVSNKITKALLEHKI